MTLAALVAGGVYAYVRFSGGGIDIDIRVPEEAVEFGAPFDLEVTFGNDSSSDLRGVRLVLELPEGLVVASGEESANITRELGDISPGGIHRESFEVVAVPSEEGKYEATVTVFYSPSSLVAEFRKEVGVTVPVAYPDVELTVEAPDTVFPGEEFEVRVKYTRRGDTPISGAALRLQYSEEVVVVGTEPEPTAEDGAWDVSLLGEDEGEVTSRAKIDRAGGTSIEIRAELTMRVFDDDYTLFAVAKNLGVEPSPLSFEVLLPERGDTVRPSERITYALLYRNNTNVELRDVVIRADLIGKMFDLGSVETGGSVNALQGRITWNSSHEEGLARLAPGVEGRVTFSVDVRDVFDVTKLSDRNFTLVVDGSIESPTVPSAIDADRTFNMDRLETKVAGAVDIQSIGLFRDAESGIVNSGPFPPRAGVPTNYTIHWRVTNFATDVDEIEVRAQLEPGVTFTGEVKGNSETLPEFDPSTREIVWRVGRLVAATGVLSERPEAIFQIAATPNGSHIGTFMPLLGETRIEGDDEFSGVTVVGTADAITTRLPHDPTVQVGDGLVTE